MSYMPLDRDSLPNEAEALKDVVVDLSRTIEMTTSDVFNNMKRDVLKRIRH